MHRAATEEEARGRGGGEQRNVLFLKEGRCETSLQSFLTHRLDIKHPFSFLFGSPLALAAPLAQERATQARFDSTFGLFLLNATCFPLSAVLWAPRSPLHREDSSVRVDLFTLWIVFDSFWLDFISDLDAAFGADRCQRERTGRDRSCHNVDPLR